jgi:hypothetical protein
MKLLALSTDQAPHISIPLRFFAVAPLFLILAALILAISPDNPFSDLHASVLLAATHALTLGFITMVMFGALQQIMPVVIGSALPAANFLAWFSQLALIAGTLLLAAGFLLNKPLLLQAAGMSLGGAFAIFISAVLISLARSAAKNASKTAIAIAIFALAAAVTLGILLLYGYSAGLPLNYAQLSATHISLALGGWVMLLIVGVSYQVVPMFQLTPPYAKWLAFSLAPAIFFALTLQLPALLLDEVPRWLTFFTHNVFWLCAVLFSLSTLILQHQRRRSIPDTTLLFFRLGMISLLGVSLLAIATQNEILSEKLKVMSGLIFMLGFVVSLIHGMLYKIVPFLIWFHLFRGGSFHSIPNMKEIIPETWIRRHWWLHVYTLAAALLAPYLLIAAWLLILCLLLQGILLGLTLFSAIAIYQHTLQRLQQS